MGRRSIYDFSLCMSSSSWASLPSYLLSEALSDSIKHNGDEELRDATFLHMLRKQSGREEWNLISSSGRENTPSLSPMRHQRTHTEGCILERWQYVFCPPRVIRLFVKLAAEIRSICPVQSTLDFPHLCSKALFMKTKPETWQLPCKMSCFMSKIIDVRRVFFFFFLAGFQSMAWVTVPPDSPTTQYRNGQCRFLSEASLGNGANEKRNSLCSNK